MDNPPIDALSHSLNIHGFGFQYAVLNAVKACLANKISPWRFEVAEFPVSINDRTVHIDFVLRNKKEPCFLVAECKRSDPALSNWCFVKAPYVSDTIRGNNERVVREIITNDNRRIYSNLQWIERSTDTYRLAFELKTGKKGDGKFGRGQFNDSVAQVLRGQNGLIAHFAKHVNHHDVFPDQLVGDINPVAFFPVIFTTAKLWASNVELTEADILTGNIDKDSIDLKERKWLIYQYSQSPDLAYQLEVMHKTGSLSDALYKTFTRSIAIVNAEGIEEFLSNNYWIEPEDWESG